MPRPRNPFTKGPDDFLRKWDDLSPTLQEEILTAIDAGMTPVQAVKKVFTDNDLKDELRNWFSDCQMQAVKIGIGGASGIEIKNELACRRWFLNKHFKGDDLSLSQRVTRLDLQKDVVSTIQANLKSAEGVTKLASQLKDYTNVEDLRGGIRELESAARKVMAGDKSAFNDFNKILRREKAYAEATLKGGDETVLQRSYMRVVKAAEKLNEKGLNAAIENAIDKKARSNAFRIAHNEAARAYGIGARTRADQDEDATGIEWVTSGDEGVCDDCDALDGLIFAKDDLPEYPAHPNCACVLVTYYGNEKNLEEHSMDTDDSTLPDEFYGEAEEE